MMENGEAKKSSTAKWAVCLCLLLFGIALYLAWLLWEKGQALAEEKADQDAKIATMRAERDKLKNLLTLTPCEAQTAIGKEIPKKPTAPATSPVSRQETGAEKVEEACVFIVTPTGPRSVATGSGFFVTPDYVVTNRHVVEKSRGKILVTGQGLGKPAFGKLVAISPEATRDYAIIRVDTPPKAKIAPLAFAADAKRTQKVGAWGFPDIVGKNDPGYARLMSGQDFSSVPELSYTEGVVSAILPRNPPLLVHTAPISPGNSGGPLVNEKGKLVGINTMITLDEESYRQASIAIAASDLEKFLAQHGIRVGH